MSVAHSSLYLALILQRTNEGRQAAAKSQHIAPPAHRRPAHSLVDVVLACVFGLS